MLIDTTTIVETFTEAIIERSLTPASALADLEAAIAGRPEAQLWALARMLEQMHYAAQQAARRLVVHAAEPAPHRRRARA
jgi:hypothetical protein